MENASKALLMAASVLIGTIILTMAVYLYASFSGSAQEIGKQMEEGQVQQFNNKFTSYVDKSGTLTIYDVVTVANLAKDNNGYYGLTEPNDNNFYIQVNCNGIGDKLERMSNLDNLLYSQKDSYSQLYRYNCEVKYNSNTGRVNIVNFTRSN